MKDERPREHWARRMGPPIIVAIVVFITAWFSVINVRGAESAHRAAHASAGLRAELNSLAIRSGMIGVGAPSDLDDVAATRADLEREMEHVLGRLDPDDAAVLEGRIEVFVAAAERSALQNANSANYVIFDGLASDIRAIEMELTTNAENASSRAGRALVGSALLAGIVVVSVIAVEARSRSRRSVREARKEVTERYQSLIENSPVHIYVIDDDGSVEFMSSSAISEIGGEVAHVDKLLERLTPEDRDRLLIAGTGKIGAKEKAVRVQSAHDDRWYEVQIADHRKNPTIGGLVVTASNVTERARLEDGLRRQAREDALTGLPNRRSLNESLADAIARSARSDVRTALLLMDLDGFKAINDTLGHPAGDHLLTAIANRLQTVKRSNEQAARLGGDEFALVLELPAADPIGAAEAAASRLLKAIQEPYDLEGTQLSIDASIGIALSNPNENADDLFRRADIALYEAKHDGGSRSRLFAPEMEDLLLLQHRLKRGLSSALDNGEFSLAYQPIVSVSSGSPIGFEALMRWQSADLGSISPVAFIPAAEQSGAIVSLGRWALEQAIGQLMIWQSEFDRDDLTMSVNASVVELVEPDYATYLLGLLEHSGLYPASLQIEVTESAFASNQQAVVNTLTMLRAHGVTVALDDFGTGYSSMGQLQQLPVDCLKIDQSFAQTITTDRRSASVVHALVELGRALGLTTVAEGVETAEQFQALKIPACDRAQGFHFARPMPAEEVPAFLSQRAEQPSVAG